MTILYIQPLFIGTTELILVGAIALLLFGGKKLPEMMRGLGQGMKSFKEGMNEPTEKPADTPAEPAKEEEQKSSQSTEQNGEK